MTWPDLTDVRTNTLLETFFRALRNTALVDPQFQESVTRYVAPTIIELGTRCLRGHTECDELPEMSRACRAKANQPQGVIFEGRDQFVFDQGKVIRIEMPWRI